VKWKIVQSCSTEGAFHCTLRLLDCAQLALTVLTQQGLLFLITAYAPNTLIHYRILAAASAVAAAGLVASAPVVSNRGTCTQPTLVVAGVYSLSASFLVMCAYVPQLFETYRVGGAYSLSYATTFMLGLGSLAVAFNYAVFQHDPWVVWVPNVICAFMQFAILLLAMYFDRYPRAVQTAYVFNMQASLLGDGRPSARFTIDDIIDTARLSGVISERMSRLTNGYVGRNSRISDPTRQISFTDDGSGADALAGQGAVRASGESPLARADATPGSVSEKSDGCEVM